MFAHVLSHYLTKRMASSPSLNIKIDIYESSPDFSAIGAGIMIWSRTYEVLKEVGLGSVLEGLAIGRSTYIGIINACLLIRFTSAAAENDFSIRTSSRRRKRLL